MATCRGDTPCAGPGGQVGEVGNHLDPGRSPADLRQHGADQVSLLYRRLPQADLGHDQIAQLCAQRKAVCPAPAAAQIGYARLDRVEG